MINEYEITEYLLKHGESIKENVLKRLHPALHLFPPQHIDLFHNFFKDGLLNEIKKEVRINLNLNFEEVECIITRSFIEKLLGLDFLNWS